ncbi:MAG: RraA family protein [Acidimicrobiales bacterium]
MAIPADTRAALARLGAATLGESGGSPMGAGLRPVWPGASLVGEALPVRCSPADNLAIHVAVASAGPGQVLVVQLDGEPERGYWGEVLTTGAEARGVVGLVIEGGVRDVAALEAHRFPVFSTMIALRGAAKVAAGSVGDPVEVGGVTVAPGDVVVGDVDGVTVLPAARVAEVVEAGRQRGAFEAELFEQLRAGATTLDLLGLDPSPVRRPID